MRRSLWLILILCASAAGQEVLNRPTGAFLGGQVSPLMVNRLDSPQFQFGCREISNAQVVDVGAVTRRPGSVYVATAPGAAFLYTFVYNEADAYVLEFTDELLRFYRANGLILDGASPYTVAMPYAEADIDTLQFYQSADTCYIVSSTGSYSPRKLVRSGHTSWTVTDCNALFEWGPFRAQNTTTTSLTPSDVTGDITLTADANTFDAEHVGAYWRLDHVMATQSVSGTFTDVNQSDTVVAGIGSTYAFAFVSSAFAGTVKLQISYDEGSTWVDDYTATNTGSKALDVNDSEISDFGENVLLRVACTAFTSGDVDYELDIDSYVHAGYVQITDYNSPTDVNATVIERLGQAASTTRWSEGAWSDYRGYPTAITGHFGRVVYAKDLSVWLSGVEDYENFSNFFAADDEAFGWTASQARQNPIRWIIGERTQNMVAGTLSKVMELRSLDELAGFTPTNPPKITSASAIACSALSPAIAESVILFADRTTTQIHELVYDSGEETVASPDLTRIAGDIVGDGTVQLAFQQTPYPTLWCVRSDGDMATCYYSRTYQIAAWSVQQTEGDYESVAVIPTSGGLDQVWTVVNRTVDSNSVYYVEYLCDLDMETGVDFLDASASFDGGDAVSISAVTQADPGQITLVSWPTGLSDGDNVWIESISGMTELNDRAYEADDCNESGLTLTLNSTAGSDWDTSGYTAYSSGGTLKIVENAFSGLSYLEGESVAVLGDGVYLGDYDVTSGAITLDEYYNEVYAGLNYTTTITPIEIDMISDGGSIGPLLKDIVSIYVNAYYTAGGRYGPEPDITSPLKWPQQAGGSVNDPSYRYTGAFKFETNVGPKLHATYSLVQDEPYPMTLRATSAIFQVGN